MNTQVTIIRIFGAITIASAPTLITIASGITFDQAIALLRAALK